MIADKEPISNNEMILTRMVEQYQLPLLKLCRMYLPDGASAEDAVQDTFMKAYKALSTFRGEYIVKETFVLYRLYYRRCYF